MRLSRILGLALAVLAVVGTMFAVRAAAGKLSTDDTEESVPVARASRGTLDLRVYTTGELQAARSATLIAPAVAGGTLRILRIMPTGTAVKAGDVVVEFDPSEQRFNLEQARTDLAQADQEIAKAKQDAAVQAAQDKVNLLAAQFGVRKAELEVSRNELVSAIDAKKNSLLLEEAKRVLAELEQDQKSHQASSKAAFAVTEEKRQKAMLAIDQAQRNIDNMALKTSLAGIVRVRENEQASGGMFYFGMTFPEFHEGDQVWPGSAMVSVLDTSQMELTSHISERDRGNVSAGQPVEVSIDALPGDTLKGKVKSVAAAGARASWWSTDVDQTFLATFALDTPEPRLRPGFTAKLVILSGRIDGALLVPRQAVFTKEGKPTVYVRSGKTFSPQEIHIKAVNEGQAAIEGLKEGAEVALVNPEERSGTNNNGGSALTLPAAGGPK